MNFSSSNGLRLSVMPADDDPQAEEIEAQRVLWRAFLDDRPSQDLSQEPWLWQYWRSESHASASTLGKKLVKVFGVGNSRVKSQARLKNLVRGGIPPEIRGKIWWACSGAAELQSGETSEGQFGALVQRIPELKGTLVAHEIEKDLHRTMQVKIEEKTFLYPLCFNSDILSISLALSLSLSLTHTHTQHTRARKGWHGRPIHQLT